MNVLISIRGMNASHLHSKKKKSMSLSLVEEINFSCYVRLVSTVGLFLLNSTPLLPLVHQTQMQGWDKSTPSTPSCFCSCSQPLAGCMKDTRHWWIPIICKTCNLMVKPSGNIIRRDQEQEDPYSGVPGPELWGFVWVIRGRWCLNNQKCEEGNTIYSQSQRCPN